VSMSDGLKTALAAWAKNAAATAGPVESDGSVLTFTGLPYGYYVVTTTQGEQAITVDSTNPNAEIVDKNFTLPIKELKKTSEDVTAQVGDTVTYTVSFGTANFSGEGEDAKQITKYTISDNFASGYLGNITVTSLKVGDEEIKDKNGKFVQFAAGKIELDWATPNYAKNEEGQFIDKNGNVVQSKDDAAIESYTNVYKNGAVLTLTYSATVLKPGTIKNTVNVSTDVGDTKSFDKEIKTYSLTINKVDGENKPLDGAEFELARDNVAVKFVVDGSTYTPATAEQIKAYEDYAKLTEEQQAEATEAPATVTTVIKAGTAIVQGLDGDDTYVLTETKAPEGYNKLTSSKDIVFKSNSAAKYERLADDAKFDANAKYFTLIEEDKYQETTVTEETFDNLKGSLYTEVPASVSYADQSQPIENLKGAELPSTGGIGTTIFTVVGATLMVGAAVLFVTKKRSIID